MTLLDYKKQYPNGVKVRNTRTGMECTQSAFWAYGQFETCVDEEGNNRYGWVVVEPPKETKKAPENVVVKAKPDTDVKSTKYGTVPADQKQIKADVEGMSAEQIEKYFEGEERQSILAIKARSLKALEDV